MTCFTDLTLKKLSNDQIESIIGFCAMRENLKKIDLAEALQLSAENHIEINDLLLILKYYTK